MKTDYRKLYGQSELHDTFLNQSAGEVIRKYENKNVREKKIFNIN